MLVVCYYKYRFQYVHGRAEAAADLPGRKNEFLQQRRGLLLLLIIIIIIILIISLLLIIIIMITMKLIKKLMKVTDIIVTMINKYQ